MCKKLMKMKKYEYCHWCGGKVNTNANFSIQLIPGVKKAYYYHSDCFFHSKQVMRDLENDWKVK